MKTIAECKTVPEVAADLREQGHYAPDWLVRRICDQIGGAIVVGHGVRLIGEWLAKQIAYALEERKEKRRS